MDAARQADALSRDGRLALLHLLLTDSAGRSTAEHLAGGSGDVARTRAELDAMVRVGILDLLLEDGREYYRVTPDALARFAGLLTGAGVPWAEAVDAGEAVRLRGLAERLEPAFRGTFEASTIHAYVVDSYLLLRSRATVRHHLVLLTERFAVERLESLAKDRASHGVRDLLFVCTRNAGRSQIAAAVARGLAGDRVRVHSAGSAPDARVDPTVARVLGEEGWPVATEFPKPLTEEVVRGADHVITLGCGDAVPLLAGRRYADWALPDPAGLDEDAVRAVVRDIERRVTRLVEELGA